MEADLPGGVHPTGVEGVLQPDEVVGRDIDAEGTHGAPPLQLRTVCSGGSLSTFMGAVHFFETC